MELQPWSIPVSIIEPSTVATPMWTRSVADTSSAENGDGEENPERRDLYGRLLDVAFEQARAQATEGSPVEEVVDAIEHAVTADKPRATYMVGKNSRLRVVLELLPVRVRDRIIMRRGLGRS